MSLVWTYHPDIHQNLDQRDVESTSYVYAYNWRTSPLWLNDVIACHTFVQILLGTSKRHPAPYACDNIDVLPGTDHRDLVLVGYPKWIVFVASCMMMYGMWWKWKSREGKCEDGRRQGLWRFLVAGGESDFDKNECTYYRWFWAKHTNPNRSRKENKY